MTFRSKLKGYPSHFKLEILGGKGRTFMDICKKRHFIYLFFPCY